MLQITNDIQPAQVLLLLQLQNYNKSRTKYFAIVRYLMTKRPSTDPNSPDFMSEYILENIKSPYKVLEWGYEHIVTGRRRYRSPIKPVLIDVSTIISTAFVVPMSIENKAKPVCGHPKYTDQFWYLESKFFDRSGWNDINIQAMHTNDVIRDLDPILLNDIYGYIDRDSDHTASNSGSTDSDNDSM